MAHPYARNKSNSSSLTLAEKRLVAAESLRLMTEDASLSRLDAVRGGMLVLDKSRRKNIKDMAHAKWIIPLWEERATELDAANVEPDAPAEAGEEAASAAPEEPAPTTEPVEPVIAEPAPAEGAVDSPDAAQKRRGFAKGTKVVRWNRGERRKVAKMFLKLKADFPDMKDLECLRKAVQYSASEVRQRNIATMASEAWLWEVVEEVRPEFEQEVRAAREQRDARMRAEQEAIDAAKEREARELAEAERIEHEKQEAVDRAVDEYKASVSIEDLLLLVAKRAASVMVGSLVDTLQTQVLAQLGTVSRAPMTLHMPGAAPVPLEQVTPPAPRDRKPRVLVVGLIGQQEQDLRRAFDDVLDLSFVKSSGEGGGPRFRDRCHNKDLIISMVGFGGHDIEDGAKRAGVHLKRVPGSISALKRWLSDWLAGNQAIAA